MTYCLSDISESFSAHTTKDYSNPNNALPLSDTKAVAWSYRLQIVYPITFADQRILAPLTAGHPHHLATMMRVVKEIPTLNTKDDLA